jgi:hypothetical protein
LRKSSGIPDDTALRLVVLPPESWHSRDESALAFDALPACVRNNRPRLRHPFDWAIKGYRNDTPFRSGPVL